ncbi:unannotated protein [freshwater metagenome]|uniref:Unannotated protein n=1 Tax=freshwater metagenome TaxID=449393 RepID=A0A6J6UFU9_9ZZZZ
MDVHLHERIDLADAVARALGLRPSDIALTVNDLALEIRLVNRVELDNAERADSGCREIHERGAAEAARPDAQHLRVLQPLLPRHANVGNDEVPAVTANLLDGEFRGRLHEGRQAHDSLQCLGR